MRLETAPTGVVERVYLANLIGIKYLENEPVSQRDGLHVVLLLCIDLIGEGLDLAIHAEREAAIGVSHPLTITFFGKFSSWDGTGAVPYID